MFIHCSNISRTRISLLLLLLLRNLNLLLLRLLLLLLLLLRSHRCLLLVKLCLHFLPLKLSIRMRNLLILIEEYELMNKLFPVCNGDLASVTPPFTFQFQLFPLVL